jgi:hypothetical protein
MINMTAIMRNMTAIAREDLVDASESKETEVSYKFTTDPLLISCTLYRLIKESRDTVEPSYLNWSLHNHADKIVGKITDQDRVFAESVKSYYMSKLLMAKLRGDDFTKFKTDLMQYLHNSPTYLTPKFIGMVYKLPYFYQYDMELVEIFGGEHKDLGNARHRDREDITLTFIAKADNGQKRARHYEYWFKDDSGTRILLEVEKHNPVRNLWEQSIQSGKLNVNTLFEKKRRDNLEFYVAKAWTINV